MLGTYFLDIRSWNWVNVFEWKVFEVQNDLDKRWRASFKAYQIWNWDSSLEQIAKHRRFSKRPTSMAHTSCSPQPARPTKAYSRSYPLDGSAWRTFESWMLYFNRSRWALQHYHRSLPQTKLSDSWRLLASWLEVHRQPIWSIQSAMDRQLQRQRRLTFFKKFLRSIAFRF